MWKSLRPRVAALNLLLAAAAAGAAAAGSASVVTGTLSGANTVDIVNFTQAENTPISYAVVGSSAGTHNLTCRLQQRTALGGWVTLETLTLRMPSDAQAGGGFLIGSMRAGVTEQLRFRLSRPVGTDATDWEVWR